MSTATSAARIPEEPVVLMALDRDRLGRSRGLALGVLSISGSLTNTNATMAARIRTGMIVQTISRFVCPRTCGPSAIAVTVSAPVLEEEEDERPLDEDEDDARDGEDQEVGVADPLGIVGGGRDRCQPAVGRERRSRDEKRSECNGKGEEAHGSDSTVVAAARARLRKRARTEQSKDAGSARIGNTGATEDAGMRRFAAVCDTRTCRGGHRDPSGRGCRACFRRWSNARA